MTKAAGQQHTIQPVIIMELSMEPNGQPAKLVAHLALMALMIMLMLNTAPILISRPALQLHCGLKQTQHSLVQIRFLQSLINPIEALKALLTGAAGSCKATPYLLASFGLGSGMARTFQELVPMKIF
ncbi:hypothetical protein ES703_88804 [subsurface metagenome]